MRQVLAGVRVLDFCWVGAGALVTKLLAEHGAEVIKVESRARPDNLRVAPPYRPGAENLDGSGYFASRNNDKKSLALNMKTEKGRELGYALASRADVVANNFRPGVMERWGLAYDSVAAVNPSVVYLSMPMQGSDGPNSGYIGFGSTIAALSGLVMSVVLVVMGFDALKAANVERVALIRRRDAALLKLSALER